jgi:hypothetical protein
LGGGWWPEDAPVAAEKVVKVGDVRTHRVVRLGVVVVVCRLWLPVRLGSI